jgi:hypothetical protein
MNHPIVYIIGETSDGDSLYASNETKNTVQMSIREIWNHRPDHDPPTWKDFFDYTRSHSIDPCPDLINVETIMEQVICLILGKRLCWTSMEEVNPMRIEPNIEDIVEEFFHRLEPVTDTDFLGLPIETLDQLIDEIESEDEETEEEEEEEEEEVTKRKEKVAEVQEILDEIMETKDQKLDQGKYLALCNLLRDVHQG